MIESVLYPENLSKQFIELSKNHSKVTINFHTYWDLLSTEESKKLMQNSSFEMMIDVKTIRTGHYSTINNMKVFINSNVEYMMVKLGE